MQDELFSSLSERSSLLQKGQTTGRVDYRLKGGLDSLKQEMKHLEKLAYLYQNDTENKYKHVSAKEKAKRVQAVTDLKKKTDRTIFEIQNTFGIQSNANLLDLESGSRGKDGEFANTRDLSSKQLLQSQRKMIDKQDVALD